MTAARAGQPVWARYLRAAGHRHDVDSHGDTGQTRPPGRPVTPPDSQQTRQTAEQASELTGICTGMAVTVGSRSRHEWAGQEWERRNGFRNWEPTVQKANAVFVACCLSLLQIEDVVLCMCLFADTL